jgi:hypothetical protein
VVARFRIPEAAWLLAVPMALGVQLIACRRAPLGAAVADDYSFLARLLFQKPLDLFDSMGATYYWRPLSRQLYFTLVGPWLLQAPWADTLLHVLVLAAIGVLAFRIARGFVAPPVAAAIAAGLVTTEPARVLLGWPSGAQHLLASLFALLAIHEAHRRRLPTATLAALAGVLSHESAALALPLLPLIAWRDRRQVRDALMAGGAAIAVVLVWAGGYAIALRHGVLLPPTTARAGVSVAGRVPGLFSRAWPAALNVEDVHGPERAMVLGGLLLAALIAAAAWMRPEARTRLRAALPLGLVGLAWFVVGVLPLAVLLPDWNSWRAWLPTVGLAFAIPALLGAASPPLAAVWVGLRIAALLVAPGAPRLVTREAPQNGSHVSFSQLVRLQRTVLASHDALVGAVPTLPPHARVCYWEMPRLAEFAYQGSRALQVWYRDSTLTWMAFGGRGGLTQRLDEGVEFHPEDMNEFAAHVPGRAIALYQQAAALILADRATKGDSLLRQAMVVLGRDHGPFIGTLYENMALNAYRRGDYKAADSLNEYALRVGVETGAYWLLRSARAIMNGDRQQAEMAIRRSLELDRNNDAAQAVARELGVLK